jgi:hypothetical protein
MIVDQNPTENKIKRSQNESLFSITLVEILNSTFQDIKSQIDYLETLLKCLQRCLYKKEHKQDIKEQKILEIIDSDQNTKLLISVVQKRLTELKKEINSSLYLGAQSFQNNKITSTNYFIIQFLKENDEVLIENLFYFIIICPEIKLVEFFLFEKSIPLNYQILNSILDDKFSTLDLFYNLSLEKCLKSEQEEDYICSHALFHNISELSKVNIKINDKEFDLRNFNFSKNLLKSENTIEYLKKYFIENNILKNIISCNNPKIFKSFLSQNFNYYSPIGQIVQLNLNI